MRTTEYSFIADAVEKYLSHPKHMDEAVDVATGSTLNWSAVADWLEYEGESRRLLESINKSYGAYIPMGFANILAQHIADRIIHLRKWRGGFEECEGVEVAGMLQRLQVADNAAENTEDWAISVDCGDDREALIEWDSEWKVWVVQMQSKPDANGMTIPFTCMVRSASQVKWFILRKQEHPKSQGCWLVCG